jgi:hypothetical protein
MMHATRLKKAGGILEIRHNDKGDGVYVFIKRKKAKVFPSLEGLISSVYFGVDSEHFTCNESELFALYEGDKYKYKQLKNKKENPDNPNQLKLWQ